MFLSNRVYSIEACMDKKHQQLITDFLINYDGDEAWQNYVSAFEKEWNQRTDKELLLSYFEDRGLAVVISYHCESLEDALAWFECSDIPAFKGLGSPKDLVLSGSAGMKFVRTVLMRFP